MYDWFMYLLIEGFIGLILDSLTDWLIVWFIIRLMDWLIAGSACECGPGGEELKLPHECPSIGTRPDLVTSHKEVLQTWIFSLALILPIFFISRHLN